MRLSNLSQILDRLESTTVGPWDTTIDTRGAITVTNPNSHVIAKDISVQDAWHISHVNEDIKLLINEVLDLRRLVFDVLVLLDDKEEHTIITNYIDAVMSDRVG